MSDLEQATGELGREIMQETLQGLSQVELSSEAACGLCPHCRAKGQKRGKRRKQVITKRGEIELERQYYLCNSCGQGFSPSTKSGG